MLIGQTKGSQDVFVSGAALAVDCDRDIGFFPDIYNEDWLFFFDDASNRRLGNSYLKVTQLTYYPFANAKRAAWQEFGDVLAEGLYSLLHRGQNVQDATPEYWASFFEARRIFLRDILARSQNADPEMRDEMVASVEAALDSLGQIKPELCARYVQLWRADLREWKRRMAGITKASSLEDALKRMRLSPTAPPSSLWRVMPHWDDFVPTATAGPAHPADRHAEADARERKPSAPGYGCDGVARHHAARNCTRAAQRAGQDEILALELEWQAGSGRD